MSVYQNILDYMSIGTLTDLLRIASGRTDLMAFVALFCFMYRLHRFGFEIDCFGSCSLHFHLQTNFNGSNTFGTIKYVRDRGVRAIEC